MCVFFPEQKNSACDGDILLKTIMFFVCSLRMGGSERACVRMANALAVEYDVTVITIWGNAGIEKELDPRIHLLHKFPSYIRGVANISGRIPPEIIYRFYVKKRYDIEIAVGDGLESHIISGSPNLNKYSWIHMNLGNYGTKKSEKSIRRYQQFKKIICVSEYNKRCFENEMGFKDKTVVVYTPVDVEQIRRMAEEEVELPNNTLVAVGRLEKVKGFARLIEAVAAIRDRDFQVLIIGDGTQRGQLAAQIRELHLEEKVILKGMLSNPYPYIKNAKALICSSFEESFGFSVVEAMLLKTPVISTRCGGVEEIIQDSTQGLLCENSTSGITQGLSQFLSDDTRINPEMAFDRAMIFDVKNGIRRFSDVIEF